MYSTIQAIFLDLGNTLRFLEKDEAHMANARQIIAGLLGTAEDPKQFHQKLEQRYKAYRDWAFETLIEAPEPELWSRWLAPEFPKDRIDRHAVELTYQFRRANGRRVVVDRGVEVIKELKSRGYTLGIISNLITSKEIPEWLEEDGLNQYFDSVLLSSVFGRRKPHPSIYLEAARRAEVDPACCAYVGDNPKRDVDGTRQAGFGMVILMLPPEDCSEEIITGTHRPDLVIHEFHQLLNYFPGRNR